MALSRNTSVVNQSGHPALSLPMGLATDGTPLGFQLVGQAHEDHALLAVAEVVERLVGFDPTPPGLREHRGDVPRGQTASTA
jgi:Asp-tRNA(Asn)/Glu-tRNA(Gln) amidotransferase A subunit family amidase